MGEALGELSTNPETISFNGCPTSPYPVACPSRGLLTATLTLLSGGFQLAVALSVNLRLSAHKHVLRRHVTDRAVQTDVVIAIYILLNQAFCIFQ